MTILIEPDETASRMQSRDRFVSAWNTGVYQGEFLSFPSLRSLSEIVTSNRWALVEKLQEIGPSSLRALARALNRDVKRVHEDVKVLLEWLLVERTEDRKLVVPYDTIQIRAEVRAPAAA